MIHPLIAYPSTRKNIVNSSQDHMLHQKNSQRSTLLPCVFVPSRFEVIEQSQIPGRVGAGVGWSRVGTLASPFGGYLKEGASHMGSVVVLGSTITDLVAQAPRLPIPGEAVIGDDFASFLGGKGFNQAVAAARLG